MKKRGIILAAIIMSAFVTGCGKSDTNSNSGKKVTQSEITTAPASPTLTEPETEITTDVSDLLDGDWTLCSKSGREFASISFSPEDSKLTYNDDYTRRDELNSNGSFSIDNDKIKINLMDNNGSYDYTILDKDIKLIYINDFSDEYYDSYLKSEVGYSLYDGLQYAANILTSHIDFWQLNQPLDEMVTLCIFSNDESKNSFKNSGLLSYFNLSMEDFENIVRGENTEFSDDSVVYDDTLMSYDEIKNNYVFFVQMEVYNGQSIVPNIYIAEDWNSTEWVSFLPRHPSYSEKVINVDGTEIETVSEEMTLQEVYEKIIESGYRE